MRKRTEKAGLSAYGTLRAPEGSERLDDSILLRRANLDIRKIKESIYVDEIQGG